MKNEASAPTQQYNCQVTVSAYNEFVIDEKSKKVFSVSLQIPRTYIDHTELVWQEKIALTAINAAVKSLPGIWKNGDNRFRFDLNFPNSNLPDISLGTNNKTDPLKSYMRYSGATLYRLRTYTESNQKALDKAWFDQHTTADDRAQLKKTSSRDANAGGLAIPFGVIAVALGGFSIFTLLSKSATDFLKPFGIALGSIAAIAFVVCIASAVVYFKNRKNHTALSTRLNESVPKLSDITVLKDSVNEVDIIPEAVVANGDNTEKPVQAVLVTAPTAS